MYRTRSSASLNKVFRNATENSRFSSDYNADKYDKNQTSCSWAVFVPLGFIIAGVFLLFNVIYSQNFYGSESSVVLESSKITVEDSGTLKKLFKRLSEENSKEFLPHSEIKILLKGKKSLNINMENIYSLKKINNSFKSEIVNNIKDALTNLKARNQYIEEGQIYVAGIPKFERVFARDSFLASFLMIKSFHKELRNEGIKLLEEILKFSALMQGTKPDEFTGEEEGKIFHEYPGVPLNGKSTLFSACDTTALFLIGHGIYFKETKNSSFVVSQSRNIDAALEYVFKHIDFNDLFIEDPKFSGADRYALKVTYWKDSTVDDRKDGQPNYPVTYSLVQSMYIRALREVLTLPITLEKRKSKKMIKHQTVRLIQSLNLELFKHYPIFSNSFPKINSSKNLKDENKVLMRKTKEIIGYFVVGKDRKGIIKSLSSDTIHMLWYLDQKDISPNRLSQILHSASYLETFLGYKSALLEKIENYHGSVIWPFEQAFIYDACLKFHLMREKTVSERIFSLLRELAAVKQFPEYIIPLKRKNAELDLPLEYEAAGSTLQLWTAAAVSYFIELYSKSSELKGEQSVLNFEEGTDFSSLKDKFPADAIPACKLRAECCMVMKERLSMGMHPSKFRKLCSTSNETPLNPPIDPLAVLHRLTFLPFPSELPESIRKIAEIDGVLDRSKWFAAPSGINFTCNMGNVTIPIEYINDDFCDCADGSDEPGTNACAGSEDTRARFTCRKNAEKSIPSSMVNDGICDCCDGSDEYLSNISCEMKC